ncbi:MAG TPA: FtsX-like permease family protein [Saprospiraceae bacterium]|nr:FtsX-like permease family protein [Saprospiraceae bacterium]
MKFYSQYFTLLPKIAWRNIGRNKGRSFLVIGSVTIGIWALIFLLAFVRGTINGYIADAIRNQTSHLQIHHPEFLDDREIQYTIPQSSNIVNRLAAMPQTRAVSARILINAMVSTAHGARGLQITGVDPVQEARVTGIADRIVEGSFFNEDGRNEIVLSRRIANKLNIGLRKKVVLTFQNADFEITTAAFRVTGIFESKNKMIDEIIAYTRSTEMLTLAELSEDVSHEIAILLSDVDSTDAIQTAIKQSVPGMKVRTFREISPDLDLFDSQIRLNMVIMTAIIMLALIFGIVNTMLMAVLERIRELGMLMAIGMTRIRVFLMIVWETVFVAVIGAPVGMLLGHLTIRSLYKTGIDLSMWASGLEQFGMSTIVRPELEQDAYLFIAIAIIITALLASMYPSLKATRLKPVDALRKI